MKNIEIIIGGVSNRELMLLSKQLYAAVRAGYDVAEALKIAQTQAKGRLRYILDQVIPDVQHGSYLHEALAKHSQYFPPLMLSLIRTGELSGSLLENLKRLIEIVEKEHGYLQKFRSAMIYPIFVLVAITCLGLSIAIFVLPSLLPLFRSLGVSLPVSTRILLWFAQVFQDHGTTIGIGFIVVLIYLFWLFRQSFFRPVAHKIALKIPFFGTLNRKLILARFGNGLGSLLKSGIPIDASLLILTSVITNYHYQKAIRSMMESVKKGHKLSQTMLRNPELFDDFFVRLIDLGEITAGLQEACDNVADYYDGEVDETMKNLAVTLEPALIIVVGFIVGFVAFSILVPIYKITGSLR